MADDDINPSHSQLPVFSALFASIRWHNLVCSPPDVATYVRTMACRTTPSEELLDDLCTRFILNVPAEDLQ